MRTKIKILFTLSLLSCVAVKASAQSKVYNIVRYGAVADGKTNNTIVIQKAIDEASAQGGGMVLVPAGKFVTGVINIISFVFLLLVFVAFLLGCSVCAVFGVGF